MFLINGTGFGVVIVIVMVVVGTHIVILVISTTHENTPIFKLERPNSPERPPPQTQYLSKLRCRIGAASTAHRTTAMPHRCRIGAAFSVLRCYFVFVGILLLLAPH